MSKETNPRHTQTKSDKRALDESKKTFYAAAKVGIPLTMSTEKLLPCPFIHKIERGVGVKRELEELIFYVICKDCGAEGPTAKTQEEAEKVWNTRTSVSGLREKVEK